MAARGSNAPRKKEKREVVEYVEGYNDASNFKNDTSIAPNG